MKISIIIIILFAFNCYGQDIEWRIESGGGSSFTTPVHITLQDLLDYAEECYADSTYLLVEQPQHPTNLVYTLPRLQWVHREPTFTGFVKYLESKK